ncbi:MAG: hypothetical protein M3Q07_16975, partial [Pseudobdellovibrionaceae bacterium]|nr:hypothetical protein [Pseudobdellovibrionaceae bacterium]
ALVARDLLEGAISYEFIEGGVVEAQMELESEDDSESELEGELVEDQGPGPAPQPQAVTSANVPFSSASFIFFEFNALV